MLAQPRLAALARLDLDDPVQARALTAARRQLAPATIARMAALTRASLSPDEKVRLALQVDAALGEAAPQVARRLAAVPSAVSQLESWRSQLEPLASLYTEAPPGAATPSLAAAAPRAKAPPPASIAFFTVDLKLPERGPLKILEFNPGMTSGFVGYQAAYRRQMRGLLWKHLAELGLPVWLAWQKSGHDAINASKEDSAAYALADFSAQPGNILSGERRKLLEKGWHKPREGFSPGKLGSYTGIFSDESYYDHDPSEDFQREFLEGFAHILQLNRAGAVHLMTDVKFLTSRLFARAAKEFRPRSRLIAKDPQEGLADEIRRAIPAERYVVKPLDSMQGMGVLVVDAADLESALKQAIDGQGDYWGKDENPAFLVEEYAASKPVKYKGRAFDGTMRVAFTVLHDAGGIRIHVLDSYWKLPSEPIGAGELREATVSVVKPEKGGARGARVSRLDKARVEEQLARAIPPVYAGMIAQDEDGVIDGLLFSADPLEVRLGLHLLAKRSRAPLSARRLQRLKALARFEAAGYGNGLLEIAGSRWGEERKALRGVVDALLRSQDSSTREKALQFCLNNNSLKREAAVLFEGRVDEIADPQVKALLVKALRGYWSSTVDGQDTLKHYKDAFDAGSFEAKARVIASIVNEGRIDQAPWLQEAIAKDTALVAVYLYRVGKSDWARNGDFPTGLRLLASYLEASDKSYGNGDIVAFWYLRRLNEAAAKSKDARLKRFLKPYQDVVLYNIFVGDQKELAKSIRAYLAKN